MGSVDSRDSLFEELYRRYYGAVVTFFLRFGVPHARARELAQDTFMRVYASLDSYHGDKGGFWSFIRASAMNSALNELRATKTRKRSVSVIALEDLEENHSSLSDRIDARPAEDQLIEKSTQERRTKKLKAAIMELPESTRLVLQLWLAGRSYNEIAHDLGITLDAIKSRLYYARRRLRELIGNTEGLDWPDGPE